jgi:hypothetical protein
MTSILFLVAVCYLVYWLFSRPKQGADGQKTAVFEDEIEFPKYFFGFLATIIIAFNIFVYGANPGIGVAVFQAIGMVTIFACLPRDKRNWLSAFVTGLGVLSSLAIAWRANGFVQSVNAAVFTSSFFLLLLMLVVDKVRWTATWLVRYFFRGFFTSIGHFFRLFQRTKTHKGSQFGFTTILRTTIITVVVLGFFVGLLSQADPIFAQLIKDVWDEALWRAVASVGVALLFTVLISLRLKTLRDEEFKLRFLTYQDVLVPGIAVGVVIGIFLFIQARYLFGSHLDLQSFNLTYSQYVRKGFTELLSAAFFGGLLTYLVALVARQQEENAKAVHLQVVNGVLILELGFLLASAWKRNAMYMEVYGLTRVRLIGEVFLLWLAGFLALLLVFAVWKKWSEAKLFLGVLGLSTFVFVMLNIQNIDQKIVDFSPGHHNFRDYFYLTALSEDGKNGWARTITASEDLLANFRTKSAFTDIDKAQLANMKLALIALQEKRTKLERKYAPYDQLRAKNPNLYPEEVSDSLEAGRKWQAWNASQHEGYQELAAHPDIYQQRLDNLVHQFTEFQVERDIDLYEQEIRLLHELKYPFITVNLNYYPLPIQSLRDPNNRLPQRPIEPVVVPSPTPALDLPY